MAVLAVVAVVACTTEVAGTPGLGEGSTSVASTTDASTGVSATETSSTTEDQSTSSGEIEEGSSSGGGGALCGDGLITGLEDCDCGGEACTAAGLGRKTCVDIGDPTLTGGTLDCDAASCRFDTSGCSRCGDGIVENTEVCDGLLENPPSCEELGKGTAGDVVCGFDCNYDTSDCTLCAYTFEFDVCDDGWTTGSTEAAAANPTWECGDPPGDPPPYGPPLGTTGVWATRLDGYHAANESSWLRSPALDLTACEGEQITLTLHHWHNFEANADGGIVQVRGEGEDWTKLTPTGGAGYGNDPIVATFPPVDGTRGFDGGTGDRAVAIATSEFDLSDYAGQSNVRLRLVFGSNANSVAPGWYIDTVEIVGGE
jgi:hypothetical protein